MNPWELLWGLVSWFLALGAALGILGGIPYLLRRIYLDERAAWAAYLTRMETWSVVQGTPLMDEREAICDKCGAPWTPYQRSQYSDTQCAACMESYTHKTWRPRYKRPDPPRMYLYHPRNRYAAGQRVRQQELIAAYERALAVGPQPELKATTPEPEKEKPSLLPRFILDPSGAFLSNRDWQNDSSQTGGRAS